MKKSIGAETIVYPAPVLIVGSYSEKEEPNVMAASWGGICCSNPPCVAVSLRKSRQSYDNILKQRAFTISIPSEHYAKEADYFGIVSGKNTDKIRAAGLTAVKSELVHAPYIGEFPLILECRVRHVYELGVHVQFVGEIMDVKAEEGVLNELGHPEMERIKPLMYGPDNNMRYYGVGPTLGRAFSMGMDLKNKD